MEPKGQRAEERASPPRTLAEDWLAPKSVGTTARNKPPRRVRGNKAPTQNQDEHLLPPARLQTSEHSGASGSMFRVALLQQAGRMLTLTDQQSMNKP